MATAPNTWIAASADGRLEVFVVGGSPDAGSIAIWHLYQLAPSGGWSQWVSHGCPTGQFLNWGGPPALASSADGRLELFFTYSGTLWHIWQTARNNGWTNWTSHGSPPGVVSPGRPALGRNADGRLELFAVAADDALWHIAQTAPSNGWSGWTTLGAPPVGLRLSPVVAASADGRLELFVAGADGELWHIWQTAPNNGWSNWTSHGSPPGVALQSLWRPVLAPSADGRLELFAVGEDKALWHIWQTAPNNGWSNWTSHGTPPGVEFGTTGGPAMAANSQNRLELFICGDDGELWHIWQTAPSNGWSNWTSHGQPAPTAPPFPVSVWGTPALALNSEKRLELFVAGSDAQLAHIWQTAPSQGWSGWLSHGAPAGFNIFSQ